MDTMNCLTPMKQSYPSKADALGAFKRQRRVPGSSISHVYKCPCGSWHLAGIRADSYTHSRKRNHRRKGGSRRRR